MFQKFKTLIQGGSPKSSKTEMDQPPNESKPSDMEVKAPDKPKRPSDMPMETSSNKATKASDITVKTSDKSKVTSSIPMGASDNMLKASEITIEASTNQVKAPDNLKIESNIRLDNFLDESPTRNTITVFEEGQAQAENLDTISESTRKSTSLLNDKSDSDKGSLSFVCISDTHCKLKQEVISQIPHADVLLHAGDFTMNGTVRELIEFNKLLGTLSHPYKVVIAGNHEVCLEDDMFPDTRIINKHYRHKFGVKMISELLTNCIYLQDELTEICGIKIYGSPWTQEYSSCNAFALGKAESLQRRWDKIPANIDILMTHGPPRGIGDTTSKQVSAGCSSLLNAVQNRIKPRYHVFGHIHEGYGVYNDESTIYINAATCTRGYKPTNRPIKFRLNIPRLSACDIDCVDSSN